MLFYFAFSEAPDNRVTINWFSKVGLNCLENGH
jgi:hypothetical protein